MNLNHLRPRSSGIDYFENNRQNLSSHLELIILENSWFFACCQNNKQKSNYYFPKQQALDD